MADHKKVSTKDLGSLLQSLIKQKNWQDRIEQHQVFIFWDKFVGELSSRTRPDIIREDVLWVSVSDPVWMQQLQFEKQTLLDHINTELKSLNPKSTASKALNSPPIIKDIRFKLDPNFKIPEQTAPALKQKQHSAPINKPRFKEFEASVSSIGDEHVEKSLKSLWLALEGRKNRQ